MSTFDAFRVLIVSPNVPSPQDGERVVFGAKFLQLSTGR